MIRENELEKYKSKIIICCDEVIEVTESGKLQIKEEERDQEREINSVKNTYK